MSSDVAVIGLTYDGADIQVLDGLFLEITQGLDGSPTAVRGIDTTVPGADGQVARPRRFHERRIALEGFVRGVGATTADAQAEYRVNVRAMNILFETGGGAAVEPKDLVCYLEDGTTATVPARTLAVEPTLRIPSEWSDVAVVLLAVEDWTYETPGS